jgi:hypothetical protein
MFLGLLAAVAETVVFPVLRAGSLKELAPVPVSEYIASWTTGTILLARPGVKPNILASRRPPNRRYTIREYASEVVTHRSGRIIDETRLEANLLSFQTIFLDADKNWVRKSKDFLKWAEKLRKVILAHTVDWNDRRFTKKAKAARKRFEFIC